MFSATTNISVPGYLQDQPNRQKGSSGFWTIEYYQPYFDVDTKQVLKRCYSTLLPTSSSYLSTHLTPAADLYGPFWTLTTLIFTLFLSSSLAASISAYLSDPGAAEYDYNFQLLSIAVSLVYAYGLALPVLSWLVLRYIGVGEWSVVEAVAVWGYGQFVWIPVSVSLDVAKGCS
jgi:protein YIPF1/2